MTDLLTRMQPIFRDIFDDPNLVVTRESNAYSVPGWDSLAHINLVSAVEQEFGLRFALSELRGLQNVGDMLELMQRKLG